MADSPNKAKSSPVRCSVYSDGAAVGVMFRLVSVRVEKAVGHIGRAVLLYEVGDIVSASVSESDDDTLAIGAKVRIEAGYGDDEAPIFEGPVISHGIEIGGGDENLLRIECRDHAFAMTQGRRSRVFVDSSDSDAMLSVAGEYPMLEASVESTAARHGELVQYYSTDWDFVLSLADRNGLVAMVDGKKIDIAKPCVDGPPVLKLTLGPDIISFHAELSTAGQAACAGASAWDPATQKRIDGSSSAPSLNDQGLDGDTEPGAATGLKQWRLQTVGTADVDALAVWADARRLRAGMARIDGSATFAGSSKVAAGSIVELGGFGKRFDGMAYVGAVEHDISRGNWQTTLRLGMPAEPMTHKRHTTAPAASGLLPAIGGLHIGKMVKPDGDPAKNGRVQIEIPTLNDNNVVWARLASTWAGAGYGSFVVPDPGDELIVGFFNDDPCYPVVLGSLYSGSRKPPYEHDARNNIRALVTKEKMRLIFDEEQKSVTVETPGQNRVVLSDKEKGITLADQNGNKLVMNNSGITIESAKALTIKAGSTIAAEAGNALSIAAKTDLKLKGLNIEVKADANLSAKGAASAELSASGQTVVKGAMVTIN